MKVWRLALWLIPLAALYPLGYAVHYVATIDPNQYFAGVDIAVIYIFLIVPNAAIFAFSAAGALLARRGHPRVALLIAAAIAACQLASTAVLGWTLWDYGSQVGALVLYGAAGAVAWLVSLWGLHILRPAPVVFTVLVIGLLAVPLVGAGGAVGARYAAVTLECPGGPEVDLTFSGLESAHFTSTCAKPDSHALVGCTNWDVKLMFTKDLQYWNLAIYWYDGPVTSTQSRPAPELRIGEGHGYGGSYGWAGQYTFDPGRHCSGTIDALLYAMKDDPSAGGVRVVGRFLAA